MKIRLIFKLKKELKIIFKFNKALNKSLVQKKTTFKIKPEKFFKNKVNWVVSKKLELKPLNIVQSDKTSVVIDL